MVNRNSKKATLRRILRQELASEFDDSTVIGGLEAFLSSNMGMLSNQLLEPLKNYSTLDRQERAHVVAKAIREIDSGSEANFAKPEQKKIWLSDSIESFKKSGKGWPVKKISEALSLNTVKDLIFHFPERHEDFSKIRKISDLIKGNPVNRINCRIFAIEKES